MRLTFEITANDKKIPFSNNYMVVSVLKAAIEKGNKDLFNEIYFYEGDIKNKKIKDFAFATYLNDFVIEKDYVTLNGYMRVTLTTPDYNVGVSLCNGLLMIKEFKYKEFDLTIKSPKLLMEKEVKGNEATFKTLAPIHIKDKENKPIEIDDIEFEKELNYISDLYLKEYRGYGLNEKLIFTPIKMKKKVIKEKIEGFKEHSNKTIMYVNGYTGIFNLKGDREDLNILLKAGLGFRRSQGYGVIDIL